LADFLSISPNQANFLPSVCLVTAGLFCYFEFSLCSIFKKIINALYLNLKVTKWAKYTLLNLRANHLISTLPDFVFVPSVLGENIPTAEFGMISAETACWEIERK
jgi:hypothetical protein